VPAPPCLESRLSLEDCLVASPQDLIAHPTFLSDCVLQPHGGHRATFSALVSSSQAFGFTHTKTFSNHNRRDQHQHFLFLYHPTPLFVTPLGLVHFHSVQEPGTHFPLSQQVTAPEPSCLESCLILGLGLGVPPQETIQFPFSHQVTVPAHPCSASCLSLEDCVVASLQELIPHKTFLSLCVLHPHGGYRATLSALVSSSHDFGFTHTTSFSNHNRRDQLQHSLSLDHPTSLFFIEPLSHPYSSMDMPTTPPILFTIPSRFQTTKQPLPIPRQPPLEKPTIHLIPTPHFHTTNHPTTHTLRFL